MQAKKCCLHCPGTWSSTQARDEHTCNLPTYIQGNLKVSSLKKYVVGEEERSVRLRGNPIKSSPIQISSCYDRFAIAKKLHAENLQHRPLPDKVDDSVFKNNRLARDGLMQHDTPFNTVDSKQNRGNNRRVLMKNCHNVQAGRQYAPALGCKTPTTNMDLAICWEAPIDPCYEPAWPIHIDGSDGGPAPAVFTLVQHENEQAMTFKSPMKRFEAKFNNVKNRCESVEIKKKHSCPQIENTAVNHNNNVDDKIERESIDLCKNLDSVHITEEYRRPLKRQPVHLRNCITCECRGERTKRPRSRSINSVPIAYQGTINNRRNGLPANLTVPRPRTPYARRDFCIDTLTPPFSIINGCRDADYPEHWRLTSVYQQSYRNPRKH